MANKIQIEHNTTQQNITREASKGSHRKVKEVLRNANEFKML